MKKTKIMFWVATIIIFLFEGILPVATANSEFSKQAFIQLGYPAYFAIMLTVFKALGAITLIVPMFPARLKEWAYAGFTFDFTSAFISMWVVYGLNAQLILPIVFLGILAVSYTQYHKLNS